MRRNFSLPLKIRPPEWRARRMRPKCQSSFVVTARLPKPTAEHSGALSPYGFSFLWALCLLFGLSSCTSVRLKEYRMSSPEIPQSFDGYTITLVTDLHVWDAQAYRGAQRQQRVKEQEELRLRNIRRILEGLDSDLILLGGDYLSFPKRIREAMPLEDYFESLKGISARDGVYAVLGNHDLFWLPRNTQNPSLKALDRIEAQILYNRAVRIERGPEEQSIVLLGLADYLFGEAANFPELFSGLEEQDFVIALAHNPDSFDLFGPYNKKIDLGLAGHTHRGQITFFGFAPIVPSQRKYLKSLRREHDYPIFTSNGVGETGLRLRVMAAPQIITIHLQKSELRNQGALEGQTPATAAPAAWQNKEYRQIPATEKQGNYQIQQKRKIVSIPLYKP